MTTPLHRKGIYNKAEKTATTQTSIEKTGPVVLMILSRLNTKILYLFLSCSEFYLPALVGHTAALVNRPNHVISLVSVGVSAGRGRKAQIVILA